jgi:myo-inositol-1(or 4)-monophosphatase
MSRRNTVTESAASDGATVAMDHFRTTLDVESKASKMDYVTEADRAAQRAVIDRIGQDFPAATIVGEEEDERKTVPGEGEYWVVDPIDGTSNFVLGLPTWALAVVSVGPEGPIAAATVAPALGDTFVAGEEGTTHNGEAVTVSERTDISEFTVASILRYGQDRDEAFGTMLRESLINFGDLRRFGCAQLTFGFVASGMLDAAIGINPDPNPWDTIGGAYVVEQAGGTVTDVHGDEWSPSSHGLIASNGKAHDELIQTLQETLDV